MITELTAACLDPSARPVLQLFLLHSPKCPCQNRSCLLTSHTSHPAAEWDSHVRALQPLGPHVAPLGVAFYRSEQGGMFPAEYDRTLFVALHGSWNRNKFNGYNVMMVRLHAGNGTVAAYEEFMTGFLQGQDTPDSYYWGGRPACSSTSVCDGMGRFGA
jgi:glucose/arabinose dehydrogenase